LGLGKVWQKLNVCGIGLFSYAGRYIVDFVNKTSRD